jgi:hypothetical protein
LTEEYKYWKSIIKKLYSKEESESNWAAHVFASDINTEIKTPFKSNLENALTLIPNEEIIEGVIYAFKWESCQPYCDDILLHIGKKTIPFLTNNLDTSNSTRRAYVLSILDEIDHEKGLEYAIQLKKRETHPKVIEVIDWILEDNSD